VSVGNLPGGSEVIIKITYITELSTDGPDISFVLPASVAPPHKRQALQQVTQTTTKTLKADDDTPTDELGLQVDNLV
jgi:poly [ADP-ribose] polymerase